mmetsp:Transcript_51666/g.96790  ORF Transcript_51666/g.96790 Transcript_51666/m.96790 type:complete len:95 (+) Transcript_51666:320-604(+)
MQLYRARIYLLDSKSKPQHCDCMLFTQVCTWQDESLQKNPIVNSGIMYESQSLTESTLGFQERHALHANCRQFVFITERFLLNVKRWSALMSLR